jgi:archaemetzincin
VATKGLITNIPIRITIPVNLLKTRLIACLTLTIFCLSCDNPSHSQAELGDMPAIIFQPFHGFPPKSLTYLKKRLSKTFPKIIIRPAIALPSQALNKAKTRYRAASLLLFLGRRTKSDLITIGFTTKDISSSMGDKGNDWGIFGLGWEKERSCIASSYRIKGNNKLDKLYKLAIHELGHTRGLMHCENAGCYMMAANGKDHFNKLKGFCPSCEEELFD